MSDAWGHWDHHGDEVQWGGIEKGLKPMRAIVVKYNYGSF